MLLKTVEANRLVTVLGLDIGGANTKAVMLSTKTAEITRFRLSSTYFPIWKNSQSLPDILINLKKQLGEDPLDALGLTITAELSDVYQTKREGINNILSCVKTAFCDIPIFVLTTDAELLPIGMTEKNPLCVAAANWAATGWMMARYFNDAVIVDVGSTSTSIIPIINRHTAARGKTDLDKLICGELVYTGSLRTNVATIVHSIPTKNGVASVSSELFALSGDVHLVLENISETDYTSETADGRGKTLTEAYARLARTVCADTDMLAIQEITGIAKYIYEQQINQIATGLAKTYLYLKNNTPDRVPVIITGLGKNFLARKAAEKIGADTIVDLDTLLPKGVALATPATGVAWMVAAKLIGEVPSWISQ
ncbi:MAG: H4MPT-linked C1 transfer pathway protein [Nitrososphaerota archaeon]|uniref:hydantoinase/oxoprolinase family protein n=1 Tax=Candidatus Bathycorpusculum sp. TaxID=2994959 RepID=UPI00281B9E5A|nr:H4MPT-linked C1 transfer pathway protein [Candidatus Termitimicrobium sp.]MCL2432659.1 H4MPT-linked C1 transfer pathway protein [Candidatus Termitimicrobium sp.]MDR0493200.1 H4MPT-linked C1 transfer pathway protein [Nitrososphaerota archaeon]